jgi:hypothetical protein
MTDHPMTDHPMTDHPMTDHLLRGLLDDASLFPPASLVMPAAVAAHQRHQTAWYSALCGPFVCAETMLPALRTALTAASRTAIELSLVVTGGADAVATALDTVAADPRIRLRAVEVPTARKDDPLRATSAVIEALDSAPLAAAAAYVEMPIRAVADPVTAGQLLAAVDAHGYRPKLRTGGVTADAFPDEPTLAACLTAMADRRIPFKATAGLHHAVRHTVADTGFEHHGFLNVLLAVNAAAGGASTEEVAGYLAERVPATVAAQISGLDEDAIADSRHLFVSFGTCSTDEPVADLIALGLLTQL